MAAPAKKPKTFVFPTVDTTSTYDQRNFDPSASSIPQGYAGHDPVKLYFGLASSNQGKKEFETTAEFTARIAKANSLPVYGQVARDGLLAFPEDFTEAKYDADKGEFAVEEFFGVVDIAEVPDEATKDSAAFSTGRDHVTSRQTVDAQNSFGATAKVEKITGESFKIKLNGLSRFGAPVSENDFLPRLKFSFPVPIKKARQVKSNLSLLFIYRAKSTMSHEDYQKATLENPEEKSTNEHYVVGDIEQIWVFDNNTGEVLFKIQPRG